MKLSACVLIALVGARNFLKQVKPSSGKTSRSVDLFACPGSLLAQTAGHLSNLACPLGRFCLENITRAGTIEAKRHQKGNPPKSPWLVHQPPRPLPPLRGLATNQEIDFGLASNISRPSHTTWQDISLHAHGCGRSFPSHLGARVTRRVFQTQLGKGWAENKI